MTRPGPRAVPQQPHLRGPEGKRVRRETERATGALGRPALPSGDRPLRPTPRSAGPGHPKLRARPWSPEARVASPHPQDTPPTTALLFPVPQPAPSAGSPRGACRETTRRRRLYESVPFIPTRGPEVSRRTANEQGEFLGLANQQAATARRYPGPQGQGRVCASRFALSSFLRLRFPFAAFSLRLRPLSSGKRKLGLA